MNQTTFPVSGIIPALVTPYTKTGEINYLVLSALVNRLIDSGADGFYVCGSTGECFLLSDNERMSVLECVVQETNGRVPVVAHVGCISTGRAAALARHARECGATAVSSVPPFYYNFSQDEIIGYYAALSEAADLPLIPYSIPAFSNVSITAESLDKMVKRVNICGLKYTSYDLFELEKIRRHFPRLCIFSGHDEVFCNVLPIGVDGAIGSTFNLFTPQFKGILAAYREGDVARAAKLQHEINAVIELFIKAGVMPSIKHLLALTGLECGGCRPPFGALGDAEKQELNPVSLMISTHMERKDCYYEKQLEARIS